MTLLSDYTEICKLTELREKEGKKFFVNDTEIAVFKIGNEVYAVSNRCPHQQSATMYDGFIEDGCVVCPVHGWKFDLRTGKLPAGNSGLTTFPVHVENEKVFVKVLKKEWKW